MPTSTIPPIYLQAGCPSCRPTNSVKALKATNSSLTIAGLWTYGHITLATRGHGLQRSSYYKCQCIYYKNVHNDFISLKQTTQGAQLNTDIAPKVKSAINSFPDKTDILTLLLTSRQLPDISLTTVKFCHISEISRQVVTVTRIYWRYISNCFSEKKASKTVVVAVVIKFRVRHS